SGSKQCSVILVMHHLCVCVVLKYTQLYDIFSRFLEILDKFWVNFEKNLYKMYKFLNPFFKRTEHLIFCMLLHHRHRFCVTRHKSLLKAEATRMNFAL